MVEWDEILKREFDRIQFIPVLMNNSFMVNEICKVLGKIFEIISRLDNKNFYSDGDIENIFCFISNDVFYLNELLDACANSGVSTKIYNIILDIFNSLIGVAEVRQGYEMAQNLLLIRNYWFGYFDIKIKKVGAEK